MIVPPIPLQKDEEPEDEVPVLDVSPGMFRLNVGVGVDGFGVAVTPVDAGGEVFELKRLKIPIYVKEGTFLGRGDRIQWKNGR
jgi:hypothetical protein